MAGWNPLVFIGMWFDIVHRRWMIRTFRAYTVNITAILVPCENTIIWNLLWRWFSLLHTTECVCSSHLVDVMWYTGNFCNGVSCAVRISRTRWCHHENHRRNDLGVICGLCAILPINVFKNDFKGNCCLVIV